MARLPPLSSIRAFEVAARYLSFTAAAEELNVTQSAVSRHIRHLEEHLGTKLFDRHHRSLTLTDAGEVYRAELTDLFRRLAAATGRVVRTNKSRLHIHSYSTFAMHWLIPRLPDFKEAHPEIDLQLTAFSKPLAAQHELIHAIIRVGAGDFDKTDRLFSVDLLPVCAPALRERAFRLGSVEALSNATLLHSIAANANWPIWAQSVGLSDLDTSKGMRFESSAMAYAAAERGLGVALAQAVFVRDQLEAGKLVVAIPKRVISARSYYLSRPPNISNSRTADRFRDWLLDRLKSEPGERLYEAEDYWEDPTNRTT